jgi:DNA-binding transcriptional LysR family regulator
MNRTKIRSLDTTALAVFSTLIEERSVIRTSERLGLTQSAVSHALTRLRSLWSDPLFVRADNAMVPTARALALAPVVADAVSNLEALVANRGKFDPLRDERRFVLGMSDYAASLYLPRLMTHCAGTSGRLSLMIKHASRSIGFDMLRNGDAELIIGNFPEAPAELRKHELGLQDFLCAAAAGHKAFSRDRLHLRDYLDADHLHVSLSNEPAGLVDAALARSGHRRRVVVTAPHFWLTGHLLAGTALIATEPRAILEPQAALHGLDLCEPPFDAGHFEFSAVWHARSDADPALKWLLGLL